VTPVSNQYFIANRTNFSTLSTFIFKNQFIINFHKNLNDFDVKTDFIFQKTKTYCNGNVVPIRAELRTAETGLQKVGITGVLAEARRGGSDVGRRHKITAERRVISGLLPVFLNQNNYLLNILFDKNMMFV